MVDKFNTDFKGTGTNTNGIDADIYAKARPKRVAGTNAIKFLKLLSPNGPWTLTAIMPDTRATLTKTFTDLERARKFIVQQNRTLRRNLHYTANPCKTPMDKKPAKSDIASAEFLWVDADPEDNETSDQFKTRILPQIASFKPQPTFEIDSGNGIQPIWRLKQLVKIEGPETIEDIEARNYALTEALGAKHGTENIERLLRLAGTTNYPNEAKRKRGRVECEAKLLRSRTVSHPLSAFPPSQARHAERKCEQPTGSSSELPQNLLTLLCVPESGGYPSRSELLFAFLTGALRAGTVEDAIITACFDHSYEHGGIYQHVNESGGRDYLSRQIARARQKLSDSSESLHSWDDPDISLLDDRRGELPDFPLDVLYPSKLKTWVEQAAHDTGTSIDHVAVPLIGIASSLIGIARRVKASTGWTQPMTSWAALVAYSGEGKTPGMDATRRPLSQLEAERGEQVADLRRAHERKVKAAKAAKAQWDKACDEAIKHKRTMPKLTAEADDPGRFIEPRIYVSDVTIEKMAELLQARPHGMLVVIDELAGWFGSMNRYSGGSGSDNQFWLSCWDGKAYTMERKTAPSARIANLLVGIVGGLQPDKIHDVFKGAADGMYARFLFSWPARPPYRPLSDGMDNDGSIATMLDRLDRLREQPVNLIQSCLPLSEIAKAVFERFRRKAHPSLNILDGREREWWAKAPAHVLRLAGTLALMRWAMQRDAENKPKPRDIKSSYVIAAVRLVRDYFWPHARACLRQIGLSQRRADARTALRWIMAKKQQRVRREDIRRDALSQRLDKDQTDGVLKELERIGWLRKIPPSERGPGRRREEWQVNPKLLAWKCAE